MGPYRTQVMKREGSVSRFESMLDSLKAYSRKCRNFYKLTTILT
jgi:hypothetical protein